MSSFGPVGVIKIYLRSIRSTAMEMDKLEFKKKVLQAAKEKQQQVVQDLNEAIERRKESAEKDDIDLHDYWESTREEMLEYVDHLAHQQEIARSELDFLNKLRIEKLHDQVTIGSVVETDKMTFYISIGIEAFEVDGKEIFGISTRAPIYGAMIGKRKGDRFTFRGKDYEIRDLY